MYYYEWSRLQKKWILQIIWSFNFSFVSFTIPIPYKIKRCVCITFCVMSFSHSWYFPILCICSVSYNSKVWEIKIVETINCAFLYIGSVGWMDGLLVGWLAGCLVGCSDVSFCFPAFESRVRVRIHWTLFAFLLFEFCEFGFAFI